MKMDTQNPCGDKSSNSTSGAKIDFHHPYTPYPIQEQFMQTVYDVLSSGDGSVGILESPTGTGKSLSLICASLTWLRDFKKKEFDAGLAWSEQDADEPAWVIEKARAAKRKEMMRLREDLDAKLQRIRAKEKIEKDKFLGRDRQPKKRKTAGKVMEDEFLLDDYEGDEGVESNSGPSDSSDGVQYSSKTLALMKQLGMNTSNGQQDDESFEEKVKIFYCSRTHSQLTQFIDELGKVKIPPAVPPETNGTAEVQFEPPKHVTLGSRKNLCIHPEISKLQSLSAINEGCQELQQPSGPKEKKCPFIPNSENKSLVNDFRDQTLASLRDIESMGDLGRRLGICPYYASREAIPASEIVTLPYPLLLQESAREALGIILKGHVVIIDEAHNLMDAINGIYATSITLEQLGIAQVQLQIYQKKYKARLNGKNRVYVEQLLRFLEATNSYLEQKIANCKEIGLQSLQEVVKPDELLGNYGVDQIDLQKLVRYLQESKLARKVENNMVRDAGSQASITKALNDRGWDPVSGLKFQTPALLNVQSLLVALTNPSEEGHLHFVIDSFSPGGVVIKYMLLNPIHHFRGIISSARAVILAGGTMSPMDDVKMHLIPYLPESKMTTLSCPHVIPKENLLAWTLSNGPTGEEFRFTFSRNNEQVGDKMIDDLGRTILNLAAIVNRGIIIFFPSYKFLHRVRQRLDRPIVGENLWQRIASKKPIFYDQEDRKGSEDILQVYSKAIMSESGNNGGILLSVVGGKLSEGINFSNDLARLVIIVGMPYPNLHTSDWKAKIQHVRRFHEQQLRDLRAGPVPCRKRGNEFVVRFVLNNCMKAVNQSIGRAIRHRDDWAAILLIDARYEVDQVTSRLPQWIGVDLRGGDEEPGFGRLMTAMRRFMKQHSSPETGLPEEPGEFAF